MTETVRMRHLADVNPPVPEFDLLPATSELTFVPLEAVWPSNRLDLSRSRVKSEVATGYVRFREGDILVPKVTPTFQAARAALASKVPSRVGAASTEVHIVRPKPGVDPRFVTYAFHTAPFLNEGVAAFQGVAGLQRVPDMFLRDFRVRAVSITQQQKLADFLDAQVARIDNVIALRGEQVAALGHRSDVAADVALTEEPRVSRR